MCRNGQFFKGVCETHFKYNADSLPWNINEINQIRYLLAQGTPIKNDLCIHGIDPSAELEKQAIYLPCLYVQKPDQWKATMLTIAFNMKYGGDEVPHNLKAYFSSYPLGWPVSGTSSHNEFSFSSILYLKIKRGE